MKPTIYITRKLPDRVVEQVEKEADVRMWSEADTVVPRSVLETEIKAADGLLCMLTDNVDAALMDQAPSLKVVSNMAVGYDNIDVEAATQRGIRVSNTPGVLTETTADLTFSLLMAAARRLTEASDFLRNGAWDTWSPMLLTGQDIYGATLGIVGLGEIGMAVAKRAKGFGMDVVYTARSRKPEAESAIGVTYRDLNGLLAESDFVCVLTPLTPKTRNLIDQEELQRMKTNAVLVNTARGGVVNEDALYEALVSGEIWGAGLDVFEQEPVPTDHPLLRLDHVVALPHIGSASIDTRLAMGRLAAKNVLRGARGDVPETLVNADVLN